MNKGHSNNVVTQRYDAENMKLLYNKYDRKSSVSIIHRLHEDFIKHHVFIFD